MAPDLRWLNQALQRGAAGSQVWNQCGESREQLRISRGQGGHTYSVAGARTGCQHLSSHTAPGTRGTGCMSGGPGGGCSGQLKPPIVHTEPQHPKIRVNWILALDVDSAFEPVTHASSPVAGKKQALPGSCIICSEDMLSKERNYTLEIPVSLLWPQRESQCRRVWCKMGQRSSAWCTFKKIQNEHRCQ